MIQGQADGLGDGFMLVLVAPPGAVRPEDTLDFVTNPAEHSKPFLIGSRRVSGIVEAPMVAVHLAREHRASLVSVPANRDDGFHFPIEKLVHVLGAMAGDVDADFLHGLNGHGVNVTGRLRAGAVDVEQVTRNLVENALGEMTAAGVSGAEDENERFGIHGFIRRVGRAPRSRPRSQCRRRCGPVDI